MCSLVAVIFINQKHPGFTTVRARMKVYESNWVAKQLAVIGIKFVNSNDKTTLFISLNVYYFQYFKFI